MGWTSSKLSQHLLLCFLLCSMHRQKRLGEGETPFPALCTVQKQDLDAKHYGVCIRQLAPKIVRVSWAYLPAGRTAAAQGHDVFCSQICTVHLAFCFPDERSLHVWGGRSISQSHAPCRPEESMLSELWVAVLGKEILLTLVCFRWTSSCCQSGLCIEFSKASVTSVFYTNYFFFPCSAQGAQVAWQSAKRLLS